MKSIFGRVGLTGSLCLVLLVHRSSAGPDLHAPARTAGPTTPARVDWDTWQAKSPTPLSAAEKELERNCVLLRSGPYRPSDGLSKDLADRAAKARPAAQACPVIVYVLFAIPLQQECSEALEAAQASLLSYCPPNACIVKLPAERLPVLSARPLVKAVFELPPEQKIEAGFRRRMSAVALDDRASATVYLYEDDADGTVAAWLEASGFEILARHPSIRAFRGRCSPSVLSVLAADKRVSFVEETPPMECGLSTSVRRCNAASVRDIPPIPWGTNITVGIIDSGFRCDHDAFKAQSGYPGLKVQGEDVSGDPVNAFRDPCKDPMGHGTAVLSVMASRWKSEDLVGVCPWLGGSAEFNHGVQMYKTAIEGISSSLFNTDVAIQRIMEKGWCRVVNGSFGTKLVYLGNSIQSRLTDTSTWSNQCLYVYCAGNLNGQSTVISNVWEPAACKNALAVGSVSNNCGLGVAWDSLMGPTEDGRFKPEIYAPGDYIEMADAFNPKGSRAGNGTSFATPHVSAIAATLMAHYPELSTRPAAAKAYLIASARRLTNVFEDIRSGLVDSAAAHGMSAQATGQFFYADTTIHQGETNYWNWNVPPGYDVLDAALCWVELPASESASRMVICDYDLKLTYNFPGEGVSSTSRVDNFEFVRRTPWDPLSYPFITIEVSGVTVPPGAEARVGVAIFARKNPTPIIACPNPAQFMIRPYWADDYTVAMRAVEPDTHSSPLYYFEELTGHEGGDSSGWIENDLYQDAGLSSNLTYAYRVRTGETGDETNETAYSDVVWICANPDVTPLVHDVARASETVSNVFSFEVRTNTWTAVGLVSETVDHDLLADDNPDLSGPYEASRMSGLTRDFIVVNGAQAGDALHFAQVTYGASGVYGIESCQGSPTLEVNGDPLADSITSADIVRMYQVELTNNEAYHIVLDATNGTADVSVWLFSRNRYSGGRELGRYDAGADAAGGGGDEDFTYIPADGQGLYGILVVNGNAQNGQYTLRVEMDTDADNDGLPDAWERQYGSPGDFTPLGDWDEDGFTDEQELQAGTCPTNGADYLAMTLHGLLPGGAGLQMEWTSVEGRRYQIRRSADLGDFSFIVVSNLPATPPINSYQNTNEPGSPSFFRIQLEPPAPSGEVSLQF